MWAAGMFVDQVVDTTASVVLGIGTIVAAAVSAYLMVKSKLDKKSDSSVKVKGEQSVEVVQGQTVTADGPNFLNYLLEGSAEIPELRREIEVLRERLTKALLRLSDNDIEYKDI